MGQRTNAILVACAWNDLSFLPSGLNRPDGSKQQTKSNHMKTIDKDPTTHSEEQAKAQLSSIKEMLRACDLETAAQDWAATIDREQCVKLLTEEGGIQCYDSESVDDLREALAVNISDRTIEPEGFEFDEESARQTIQEDPLSVEVRSGWHTPGDEEGKKSAEFCILLCTGGPAVRIRGELDQHGEPDRAWMEHQDWGTPWTELICVGEDNEALIAYARHFYYAEE
jgi:hypothetical protein